MNPLLHPYNTAPFSKIENKHFLTAISKLIEETKAEIDAITSNTEKPTFKNTVEALENTGELLERATSIFFNLNSAETNDEIQKLAQEISPMLTEFSNDMLLNENLFERLKTVYNQKEFIKPFRGTANVARQKIQGFFKKRRKSFPGKENRIAQNRYRYGKVETYFR